MMSGLLLVADVGISQVPDAGVRVGIPALMRISSFKDKLLHLAVEHHFMPGAARVFVKGATTWDVFAASRFETLL